MCGIAGTYLWTGRRRAHRPAHRHARAPRARRRRPLRPPPRRPAPVMSTWDTAGCRIIDLSETGAQPMVSDGLAITYNGELYNAPELRRELEAAGVRFRGTSDTEVVLEAFRRWGTDCLPRLRGMFAFGIFDERTGELIAGPRPARHQAAVRRPPRRRDGVLLRAQGARVRGGRADRGRRRARRVAAVLLGPRPALRVPRGGEAARPARGCGCGRTAASSAASTGTSRRSPRRRSTCRRWTSAR